MGRCIRRLVSLFDTLGMLVAENDRRSILEEEDSGIESTDGLRSTFSFVVALAHTHAARTAFIEHSKNSFVLFLSLRQF
jgi:hypothetical protein